MDALSANVMIKLRLSDCYSFAVEFEAASESQFIMALYRALDKYYNNRKHVPELHVRTDISRDWIPPNYPDSNAPIGIRETPDRETAAIYWSKSVNALLNGNYFDQRLAEVIRCLTGERKPVDFTVIEGGKK